MLINLLIFFSCFLFSALLLAALQKLLPVHFLAAGFNARSNHSTPARQIGGLACIPVCLIAIYIAGLYGLISERLSLNLTIAAALIWLTGALDDKTELSVRIRLPVQLIAAALAVYGFGDNVRLFPSLLPQWLEAVLLTGALLSSINVANFMDGLDWLTICGIGIPLLMLGIIAALLLPDPAIAIIALSLSGALAGFAIFNRPAAKVFLGDSGSLPLGLLTGAVFLLFAQVAGLIPALILPLYYIADSGSTIILRLRKGENILQAHSSHAYQIAKRAGKSVYHVTGSIAALNIVLALITVTILPLGTIAQLVGLAAAGLLTGLLIIRFRKPG